jgi:ABC-2 type transport system permease protein
MSITPPTLRAELRKSFATPGAWIAYALLVALTVGFSLFIASGSTTDAGVLGGGDNDIVSDALSGVAIGAIVAAVIGAIAIGNEYASGMIASTFAAQPRRARVLISKAILVGGCTTAVGVAAAFAAFFVTRPLQRSNGFVAPGYPDPDLTSEPVLRAILGSGALYGVIALLALGIGMVVKRTAITIPIVIGLILVPAMLVVDESVARKVQSWSPFAGFSIQHTVDRDDYYTASWAGLAVLTAYAAAALAIGIVVTRRRDV